MYRANPNLFNLQGHTPLSLGISYAQRTPICKATQWNRSLLLQSKGTVSAPDRKRFFDFALGNSKTGETCLHIACAFPALIMAIELLKAGSNPLCLDHTLRIPREHVPLSHITTTKYMLVFEKERYLNILSPLESEFGDCEKPRGTAPKATFSLIRKNTGNATPTLGSSRIFNRELPLTSRTEALEDPTEQRAQKPPLFPAKKTFSRQPLRNSFSHLPANNSENGLRLTLPSSNVRNTLKKKIIIPSFKKRFDLSTEQFISFQKKKEPGFAFGNLFDKKIPFSNNQKSSSDLVLNRVNLVGLDN